MTRLAHIVTERREDKRRDREEERREKTEQKKENAAIPRSEEGEGEKSGGEIVRSFPPGFSPSPSGCPSGFGGKQKKGRPVSGRTGVWRAVPAPAIWPPARFFP